MVDPSVSAGSLLLICSQVKSALTWSCPAPLVCDTALAFNFVFSSEDQLGYRIVFDALLLSHLLPSLNQCGQSRAGFLLGNVQVLVESHVFINDLNDMALIKMF